MKPAKKRPAIINPNKRTPKEWFRMGKACLSDNDGPKDYEQAAFCFRQASSLGHSNAQSKLEALEESGKGVAIINPADNVVELSHDDFGATSSAAQPIARTALENNPNRCPSCGATVYRKHPQPNGSYLCARDEGGCGEHLYLPIEESNVKAGFAIQPYKEQQKPVVYSFFGRCVHEVKYDDDLSDGDKQRIIVEAVMRMRECCVIEKLLDNRNINSALVVPAPSSVRRRIPLVHSIAEALADDNLEYADLLKKHSRVESKNRAKGVELIDGEITCVSGIAGRTILLVDDTYGEGATLRACVKALKQAGAGDIFFLCLCRNTFGGMKGQR